MLLKDAGYWTCGIESYVLGAPSGYKDTATIKVTQFCGAGEYTCEHSGICIASDKICDGTVDCTDNEEDEWTPSQEPTECFGPKNFLNFDVFDAFTGEQVDSTAIYQSDKNVLKLYNITNEMPYILKKYEQEITRFYLMTNMTLEEKSYNNNTDLVKNVSTVNSYYESILYYDDMPQFMSIVMIQGFKDIKINGKKFNESDIGMRFTVNKSTTYFALNVKFRPYEDSSQLNQLPFDYAKIYSLEITLKVS